MIILTKNEIKNGWTEPALKKYRKEMDRESHETIYAQRQPKRQTVQNNRYRPQKWRRS